VGSHRYNGVRRERISGGSLTFPFVGSHDALGNHVIRFRLLASWRARRRFSSLSRPRVREDYDARRAAFRQFYSIKTGSFVAAMFVNVAKRCATMTRTVQLSRSLCASQLQQFDDRRPFTLRRYRGNFVQTQIIHCRCSRKRLSDGIRNYMLNQEGIFWQIICKYRRAPPLHQYAENLLPTDFTELYV